MYIRSYHSYQLYFIMCSTIYVAYGLVCFVRIGGKEDTLLTPALKGIVVGHWSQVGTLERKHINKDHHNVFIYVTEFQKRVHFVHKIILR